jgi:hypothetical protein
MQPLHVLYKKKINRHYFDNPDFVLSFSQHKNPTLFDTEGFDTVVPFSYYYYM